MIVRRIRNRLPATVAEYWQSRTWDRWTVETQEVANRGQHIRQRELSVSAVKSVGGRSLRVLDLCCGTGRVTNDILALDNVDQVVALDINAQALKLLRKRLEHHPQKYKLITVNGNFMDDDLLHSLGPFDVVVCLDALHHFPSLDGALIRIHKIMTAGGVFIGNYLRGERFACHIIAIIGRMRYLRERLTTKVVRSLSFVPIIWESAGRRGIGRLIRMRSDMLERMVEARFEILKVDHTDYYWFSSSPRMNPETEQ